MKRRRERDTGPKVGSLWWLPGIEYVGVNDPRLNLTFKEREDRRDKTQKRIPDSWYAFDGKVIEDPEEARRIRFEFPFG